MSMRKAIIQLAERRAQSQHPGLIRRSDGIRGADGVLGSWLTDSHRRPHPFQPFAGDDDEQAPHYRIGRFRRVVLLLMECYERAIQRRNGGV